eukprot:TRINITY_DN3336_c0_g1_i2.p1 TRINITY_DN3336_c0_g1~~TRINITY_DN3336_c0_g1_i2.p1  ORF type:complete len:487 (+),score=140.87 TRINITY_DN3336_c0_g1_i2:1583-3043(+)
MMMMMKHTTLLVLALCLFVAPFLVVQGSEAPGEYYERENSDIVTLSPDNFAETETGTWLIEFYAPWCGYCKRIAPIFEDVASAVKQQSLPDTHVGKVNCDVHSALCRRAEVKGYPTIKVFLSGFQKNYHAGREKKDFLEFLKKVSQPAVYPADLQSLSSLVNNPTINKDKVAFVAVRPTPTLSKAFRQAAARMTDLGSPPFYEVTSLDADQEDTVLRTGTTPSIVLIKAGEIITYKEQQGSSSSSADATTYNNNLYEWMKHNQFPILTQLDENNFDPLMESGLPVAMAVVDPKSDNKKVEDMMFKLGKEGRGGYLYGILDGVKYHRWISSFGATPEKFPLILVMDDANEIYFEFEDASATTDGDRVGAWIDSVKGGQVKSKTRSLVQYYMKKLDKYTSVLVDFSMDHMYISLAVTGIVTLLIVACCIKLLLGSDDTEYEMQQQQLLQQQNGAANSNKNNNNKDSKTNTSSSASAAPSKKKPNKKVD